MVSRCELFLEIVRRTGLYHVIRVVAVKTGEQVPSIFVLENRGGDAIRQDLKAQVPPSLHPLLLGCQKPFRP